ncbi:MAG TPA: hypothetical protein VKD69_25375 [Vicinamibacterales bacterium]|nr:hypothetical protein [Vicinamibacterales bacterium]
MTITVHPGALGVAVAMVAVLWAATDLHWAVASGVAVVVYGVLEFAGVFGAAPSPDSRR